MIPQDRKIITDPDGGYGHFLNKLRIECCFILKGKIERGIKLLDSIETVELNKIDIMDIGLIGMIKAKNTLNWLYQISIPVKPVHSLLDEYCKMSILKVDDPFALIKLKLPNISICTRTKLTQ